jgi:hypothetical protein
MSELGYVQWKSHTIPIIHIEFHHGGAKAYAEGYGPFEPYEGTVDIYGTDGFLICSTGIMEIPKVRARQYLKVDFNITFGELT